MRQITTASAPVTNASSSTRATVDKPSAPAGRSAAPGTGAGRSESGRFREVIARKRTERLDERRPGSKPLGRSGTENGARAPQTLATDAMLAFARETSSAATLSASASRTTARDASSPLPDRTELPSTGYGPLSGVRLGTSRGTTHLHAKIAEGRFAGVELRATEHAGRVQITLIASEVDVERQLRADLDRMHDGLAADRARDVSIVVTHETSSGGGANGRHDAPSRDPGRGEEPVEPLRERRVTHVASTTARGEKRSDGDEWIF